MGPSEALCDPPGQALLGAGEEGVSPGEAPPRGPLLPASASFLWKFAHLSCASSSQLLPLAEGEDSSHPGSHQGAAALADYLTQCT